MFQGMIKNNQELNKNSCSYNLELSKDQLGLNLKTNKLQQIIVIKNQIFQAFYKIYNAYIVWYFKQVGQLNIKLSVLTSLNIIIIIAYMGKSIKIREEINYILITL